MRFFERFGSSRTRKDDVSDEQYIQAHNKLLGAVNSYNSTAKEVAASHKKAEEVISRQTLEAKASLAGTLARLGNIELLKEQETLKVRNQLSKMKLKYADPSSEEFLAIHTEIDANTTRIAEIELIVETATSEAQNAVHKEGSPSS